MITIDFITALFYEVDERPCTRTLRINTTGSPADLHKGKKA